MIEDTSARLTRDTLHIIDSFDLQPYEIRIVWFFGSDS
jgi:hypothetical protein